MHTKLRIKHMSWSELSIEHYVISFHYMCSVLNLRLFSGLHNLSCAFLKLLRLNNLNLHNRILQQLIPFRYMQLSVTNCQRNTSI